MKRANLLLFLVVAFLSQPAPGAGLSWVTRSAVVWGQHQRVQGILPPGIDSAFVLINGSLRQIPQIADTFSLDIWIRQGAARLVGRVVAAGTVTYSDTLVLTLGYRPRPEASLSAEVSGTTVTLRGSILENPDSANLSFAWSQDSRNPAAGAISTAGDSTATVTLSPTTPPGEYYFTWTVAASDGDTVRARTFVTKDSSGIRPFNIRTDHASWIDSAVIYEVRVEGFARNGQLAGVTERVPELVGLGVTTLWLQPIFEGGGYRVFDPFRINGWIGTEQHLRTLVSTAHAHGLRVILDLVPNHMDSMSPIGLDARQYGARSHYYDFFQRSFDTAPYSSAYETWTEGKMTFVGYSFFGHLPNMNLDNPEVRRMTIELGKYWIEKFDVDGYRVDAAWAMTARRPDFTKEWRLALKRVKPDALLLGEDKATRETAFDERFDVAFDWYPEEGWVSHWAWQPYWDDFGTPTIFTGTPAEERADSLRAALTNHGQGFHPRAKVLHFMENNDIMQFFQSHGLPRTKMVAALLFSLHGIPMLFAGQEVAIDYPNYESGQSMQSRDEYGLFPFYRNMMTMRRRFSALWSENFREVPVTPNGSLFAFHRWRGSSNVFAILNMADTPATAALRLPVAGLGLNPLTTYYLTDFLTGDFFSGRPQEIDTLLLHMPGYTTRVLILDTAKIQVTGLGAQPVPVPSSYLLEQNYPNPFNPWTTIRYVLPRASVVRLAVYNLLGQNVSELVNGDEQPGVHEVRFDGSRLASGVYFYCLHARALTSAATSGTAARSAAPSEGTGEFYAVKKFLLVR